MAADSGHGMEEVNGSEISFHHERPDSRAYRQRHVTNDTLLTMDLLNAPSLGIYGWKKRCLYFSFLLLLVVIIVNLGLTIWILVVLDFNVHGMGNLRITESGLRLQGRAEFTDTLYAHTVASEQDSSLLMQSAKSVNVTSGQSQMSLLPNDVILDTPSFTVYTQGPATGQQPVLSVSDQQVVIGADSLEVGGPLGVTVEGGVEVSSVNSVAGSDLSVEAAGGRLELVGRGGLRVEGGFTGGSEGVEILSHSDLKLASQSGSVVLSSSTVKLTNIPATSDTSNDAVMEVCVCASGRLYLVPATASQGCQDDNSICTD